MYSSACISTKIHLFFSQLLEIKPTGASDLPISTRVCVYWSQQYNCLFPGTVSLIDCPKKENMIQVDLDDGDRRQVDISNVRLLPKNYDRVGKYHCTMHLEISITNLVLLSVYDPDPIASLRKRRISSDSVDSGSGERYGHRPIPMAPLTSYMAPVGLQESPVKKRSQSGGSK